jgi:outer membrane protein
VNVTGQRGMTQFVKTRLKTGARAVVVTAGVLALAFFSSPLCAQSKPAGSEAAAKPAGQAATSTEPRAARGNSEGGTKIAAVNLRAAIASTAEGKQAAAQLETQFAERRKEIEDLNKKIADLQQKLSAGGTVMSDDEKVKIQTEGQKLTRQLDRRQQDFQEDLSAAQNEVVQRIGQRVVAVIGKYAPGNGYAAVLDDSGQSTPVMYAATDITQDIVKLYDQTYPAKASAATPQSKPGSTGKPSGQEK